MSSGEDLKHQAGEAKGKAEVKKDQMMDKASETAQSMKESAQSGKDQSTGFLQQTGEQVKSMAQGAADAVKNTLGVGENNPTSKQ